MRESNTLDTITMLWFRDIYSVDGWQSVSDLDNIASHPIHFMCGIVVAEYPEYLVLTKGFAPDNGGYMGLTYVPKGCIIKKKEYVNE